MRLHSSHRLHRKGVFTLEAILGLALIVIIAAALGVVVDKQQRAAILAADRRAAVREVEGSLTLLQSGQSIRANVSVKRLESPAPTGWMWVEVSSGTGSRPAVLTGLVPVKGVAR